MAKTYPTLGPFVAGAVLTAAQMTNIVTYTTNLRVPASVRAYRATNLTGYTSASAISFSAEAYDTDGMYAGTGTNITVQTSGIYMITLQGLWNATATVTQYEAIVSLGATPILRCFENAVSTTAGRFNLSGIVSLTAADVITAAVSFVGGSAYVIAGGTDPRADTTSLSLTWVGQTA